MRLHRHDGSFQRAADEKLRDAEGDHCLTCQSRPLSDLTLDAPTVPATPRQRVVQAGARVADVQRPTGDAAIVKLPLPAGSGFAFRLGQYAEVVMRDGQRRSYAMANRPDEEGFIEWHVRRVPNGRFSEHAHAKLKARDLLR
ncbi:FAD-binding oxidoreductase [Variovorax rhizosphaerae]|uniref:FAD-binding oxidoreductase n=1 Tax=Variovorax rhizosphaerae TaxID=1836200 RepID=A0ABU8WJ54_9BURK